MKKFLTLLIAVSAFAGAEAQSNKIEEAKRIILNGENGGNNNDRDIYEDRRVESRDYPYGSSRDAEVNRVNREYDAKIQSIRNNPYLSSSEKERAIRQLENDRARRIRQIEGNDDRRYDDRRDNDDDYKKDKKNKSNNGKHKGWTQGKGNQKKRG
jgi:Ni/Co efflux regulator RcnB